MCLRQEFLLCLILVPCSLVAGHAPANQKPKKKEPEKQKKEEPASAVGKRYIAALAAENMAAVKKCWLQWGQYEEIYKSLPKAKRDMIPPEEIKKHKAYIAKRDEVIADFIPKLIKKMKVKGIDVKSLKHIKTEASVQTRFGRKVANGFTIYAKDKNGTTFRLRVDDGLVWKGRWYFTDKPHSGLDITSNGKNCSITSFEN